MTTPFSMVAYHSLLTLMTSLHITSGRANIGWGGRAPRWLPLTLIVALALFVLGVACAGQPEQKEFRIGLIAPITGNIPDVGQSTVDAANPIVPVNYLGATREGLK